MTSTFTKQLSDFLRKVEIERRKVASDTIVFNVPQDISELNLLNAEELESFVESISSLYAEYKISAKLDFSGGDDEEMQIHLMFHIGDNSLYKTLLEKLAINQFPALHLKKPTYHLSNGLVINSEQGTLSYKEKNRKIDIDSNSGKLLLALVANNSGNTMTSEKLCMLIDGKASKTSGMTFATHRKNLLRILKDELEIPKSEIDALLHYTKGLGYKNTLDVEVV